MEHLNMQTPDGAQLNLDALYKICPSVFTEGRWLVFACYQRYDACKNTESCGWGGNCTDLCSFRGNCILHA